MKTRGTNGLNGIALQSSLQFQNGPVIKKILVPDVDRSPDRKAEDGEAEEEEEGGRTKSGGEEKKEEPAIDLLAKLSLGGGGAPGAPLPQSSSEAPSGGALPSLPKDAKTLEMIEESFKADAKAKTPDGGDTTESESGSESASETLESFLTKYGHELTPSQAKRVSDLVPKNMVHFQLERGILTMGQVKKRG